jgi:hypothetical protein
MFIPYQFNREYGTKNNKKGVSRDRDDLRRMRNGCGKKAGIYRRSEKFCSQLSTRL